MNHIISILFESIDQLEEDIKGYKNGSNAMALAEWGIKWRKEQIKEISYSLNPQIPEPWASMTADEIIKGLGVYK